MSGPPSKERGDESSRDYFDDPRSDELSAEMTHLREAARVAPWVEIARANLEQEPARTRRFGRRKP